MAQISASRQLFGGQCTYDRVIKEMAGWSDHELHSFAGGVRACAITQLELRAPWVGLQLSLTLHRPNPHTHVKNVLASLCPAENTCAAHVGTCSWRARNPMWRQPAG